MSNLNTRKALAKKGIRSRFAETPDAAKARAKEKKNLPRAPKLWQTPEPEPPTKSESLPERKAKIRAAQTEGRERVVEAEEEKKSIVGRIKEKFIKKGSK